MVAYRYSEWDGSQEIPPLDPDEVLEALTDDLMNFGDLQHAMRNLLQRGMRNGMGNRLQGLRDLLQQLRQQRRNTLDRYNLSSVMDDIKNRLDDLLRMERETIERRLSDALGDQPAGTQDGESAAPGDGQESGQPSRQDAEGQASQGQSSAGQPSMSAAPQAGGAQSAQSGGGESRSGDGEQSSGGQQSSGGGDQDQFSEMLRNIANRKKNFLSNLPQDVPGAVKELQNYEFMDPEAQHKFTELMEMLKKAMTETFFKDMYDQIANMSPEEMARMKQMVKDMNQMLSDRLAGGEPDFEKFMQQYGDLFGPNPPQ